MIARSSLSILFGASFALAFALTNVRDAEACGGCFHPEPTVINTGTETTSSVITDHRMVFKISQNETILWDQVRYTGRPDEFAWVLPVREGAKVELSRDEFIRHSRSHRHKLRAHARTDRGAVLRRRRTGARRHH